jgi:hypothetical protein
MKKTFLALMAACSFAFAEKIVLTPQQANYVAKKVWQNEGAGKDKYLIWWNDGEDFMSLGIGHFIWFPRGHTERFREVFPMVLRYMIAHGAKPPAWLRPETDAPWNSKAELMRAKKFGTPRYKELFSFLKRTMGLQASFMAQRMIDALPQMLEHINDPKRRDIVARRFRKMLYKTDGSVDERGLYILVDYVNFKGEGTLESERYKGQGWGLLQVLEHMDENASNKYKAFSDSAKAMLERRIRNSPPERGEKRWRKGWFKRLDTYWK